MTYQECYFDLLEREFRSCPEAVGYEMRNAVTRGNVIYEQCSVMYGKRLRCAYFEGFGGFYELDICCGSDPEVYAEMFCKVATIIKHNPIDDPFKDIPRMSKIKPYPKDDEFVEKINRLVGSAFVKAVNKRVNGI